MFPIQALRMRGASVVTPGVAQYVSNDGGTQPRLGQVIYPSALYHSAADTTWLAWESWNGTNRVPKVAGLDHSTGYWTDIESVGVTPLVDDDHGTPAICADDEGYLHVFHGNHATDQRYSSTRWAVDGAPGEGSMWAIRDPIAGEYTYPHPVAIGSDIYLLVRKTINASTKMPLVVRKTATLAAGVATWDAEITLVDFGTDSRFYIGSVEAVGTDIHIVATRADFFDNFREDVYYFIYKTATGAVTNHDGTYSVASGSLPITLANADANCSLFAHSGSNHDGGVPALCFDTSGDPHVLFKDGTGDPDGTFDVKHIKRTSGTWSSPAIIATVTNRFNCPTLVPLSGDRVEAWYPVGANRFGNMTRIERSSGGTWGTEQTIVSGELGNPSKVLNGLADARVVFCEAIDDTTDASAGGLRDYLYGDGGLVPYEQAPEAATTPDTLQLNAENLQLNGEDLTLGV